MIKPADTTTWTMRYHAVLMDNHLEQATAILKKMTAPTQALELAIRQQQSIIQMDYRDGSYTDITHDLLKIHFYTTNTAAAQETTDQTVFYAFYGPDILRHLNKAAYHTAQLAQQIQETQKRVITERLGR